MKETTTATKKESREENKKEGKHKKRTELKDILDMKVRDLEEQFESAILIVSNDGDISSFSKGKAEHLIATIEIMKFELIYEEKKKQENHSIAKSLISMLANQSERRKTEEKRTEEEVH